MDDLNFIEKVFGAIHFIWLVLCGIIALVLIVGMFNSHGGGETFSLFIALVLSVVFCRSYWYFSERNNIYPLYRCY